MRKVPVVVELDEAVAVLDDDLADPAVTFEEPFQLAFPRIAGDVAHVNPLSARHLPQL